MELLENRIIGKWIDWKMNYWNNWKHWNMVLETLVHGIINIGTQKFKHWKMELLTMENGIVKFKKINYSKIDLEKLKNRIT